MSLVKNFIIPIIEIAFVGGLAGYGIYILYRGTSRSWKQQLKWTWKYKIRRKSWPEKTVAWCLNAIEQGIGYYDAKKILYIKNGQNMDQVYETLFIYDELINDFAKNINKTKNEKTANKKFGKNYSVIERLTLPQFSNSYKEVK